MSKLLPVLSGVACLLWVSGWTWIIADGDNGKATNRNPAHINILLDSVQYKVQQPFAFEYSEATPVVSENLHPALKSVVNKLEKNPKSTLRIIGVFGPVESNQTTFPNLGLARAASIKSILLAGGAEDDRIETAGLEAANLFAVDNKLIGTIYFSFTEQNNDARTGVPADTEPPAIGKDGQVQTFVYKYGDYKVENSQKPFLKKLIRELSQHANSKVKITGYSAEEEEAESERINLAEMRALAIRRYLVDHGVRRAQIEVNSKPSMAKSNDEMIVSIQIQH